MLDLREVAETLDAARRTARSRAQDGNYPPDYRAEMKGRADAYEEALDMVETVLRRQSGVIRDPFSIR